MSEIRLFDNNGNVIGTQSVEDIVASVKVAEGLKTKFADGSVGIIPFELDGKMNPDLAVIIAAAKRMKEEAKPEVEVIPESDEVTLPGVTAGGDTDVELEDAIANMSDLGDDEVEVVNSEYDENLEEKSKGKEFLASAKKHFKKIALALAVGISVAVLLFSCSKKQQNEVPPATIENTQEDSLTIADLKEDSRYTKIEEEALIDTVTAFKDRLAEDGIEISAEDALYFVTLANLNHIEQTNPELAEQIFADSGNVETIISGAGHVMGKIVTNEITPENTSADYWTMVFMDETDKAIADDGMQVIRDVQSIIDEEQKAIAAVKEDTTLTDKEKEEKIDAIHLQAVIDVKVLVEDDFVSPNYDATIGYDLTDGTHIGLSQTDGADFMTNAIIPGILMGDNTYKNYVNVDGWLDVTYTDKDGKEVTVDYYSYVAGKETGDIDSEWTHTVTLAPTTEDQKNEWKNGNDYILSEATHDLLVISANETTISNLTRIIEGCQDKANAHSVEAEENTNSTKVK